MYVLLILGLRGANADFSEQSDIIELHSKFSPIDFGFIDWDHDGIDDLAEVTLDGIFITFRTTTSNSVPIKSQFGSTHAITDALDMGATDQDPNEFNPTQQTAICSAGIIQGAIGKSLSEDDTLNGNFPVCTPRILSWAAFINTQ